MRGTRASATNKVRVNIGKSTWANKTKLVSRMERRRSLTTSEVGETGGSEVRAMQALRSAPSAMRVWTQAAIRSSKSKDGSEEAGGLFVETREEEDFRRVSQSSSRWWRGKDQGRDQKNIYPGLGVL